MLHTLSLRLRVFLFFALVALGALVAVGGGLWLGYGRLDSGDARSAFVFAGTTSGFVILGLVTWVWLLFDENVAKAVDRLANEMRARAHADVTHEVDAQAARYLGDLAPAAAAVTANLTDMKNAMAEAVGRETARIAADRTALETVLRDLSDGVLLCTAGHRIAFYNGAARALLGAPGQVRLDRSLADLVEIAPLAAAHEDLATRRDFATTTEVALDARQDAQPLCAALRLMEPVAGSETAPGYVLTLRAARDGAAPPREAVYDFDLLHARPSEALRETPLDRLTYVIFDTETTGLLPDRGDEVCQIAATRVVNGKRVAGEVFDTLVNPGRSIPLSATNVHGITNDMVADAPDMVAAGRRFHDFCAGAVLVAHNAPFDMAFFYRRQNEIGARFDHPVLDTVLLSAVLYGTNGEHSLDAIADRLGVRIADEDRHTALGDAVATTDVFLKMLPMLKARGVETFGQAVDGMKAHGRLLKDLN